MAQTNATFQVLRGLWSAFSLNQDQWDPGWWFQWKKKETNAKENKEGQGAIKTHSHLSPYHSLHSPCVTKVTLLRALHFFFYHIWRLSLPLAPLIISEAVMSTLQNFFYIIFISDRMIQISLLSNKLLPPVMSSRNESILFGGSTEWNYTGSRLSLWRWHFAPYSIFYVMTPLLVFYLSHYFFHR